ncbi:hypothetical protein BJF79_13480 [Actinomadura sp. CNU-125]|uniref:LexA family protein n=1 Tax=Actinomadura sp. CNU-125 TaxID=1904961 RepID=UPI000965B9F4|nr:hypothetical protein [Actinomadura sp. CNU-125]OLT24350.1 hypothetical protein BJF79_13480 [Actinomadura sp. CNU-125]
MPEQDTLTRRQEAILLVITDGIRRRGYPPSIREIGDAVGLSSTSSVAHQLRQLEGLGRIRRDPYRCRTIELIPNPEPEPTSHRCGTCGAHLQQATT